MTPMQSVKTEPLYDVLMYLMTEKMENEQPKVLNK